MTFWGSRSYQVWLTRDPISLLLVLFMLKQQRDVDRSRQKSTKTVVLIINIFKIEQIKMVLFSLLKHYSQLIGYLLLTTQTIFMVLFIIWGITAAFFWLTWQLTLLFFQFAFSQKIILVIVWILILKRWNNNHIYSFLTMMCGDRALHGIFECEMCKNTNCDLIFDKCYHTFHSNCIDSVEEYVTAKVCPKCLDQKLISRVYPNIISKMIKGLNINRLSLISLVVFGAAINGVYNYGQNYWNFPN